MTQATDYAKSIETTSAAERDVALAVGAVEQLVIQPNLDTLSRVGEVLREHLPEDGRRLELDLIDLIVSAGETGAKLGLAFASTSPWETDEVRIQQAIDRISA